MSGNDSNQTNFNPPSRAKFFGAACLWLASMMAAYASGTQNSADYNFSVESIDAGGLRSASTNYVHDGGLNAGNFVSSADYAQRGGYVGQLNNAPVATNYPITVVSNIVIKVPIADLLNSVKDVDGDSITFVSVASGSAQNGTAGRAGNFVAYNPPSGFTGGDSIAWVAQDSEGDRTTGTILPQVGAPSAPPNQPTLNLVSITFNHAPGATDATLRFAGLPQSTYTVQYTDSLAPPITWTTLGNASVTNGVFQIIDPTAGGASQRYYRTMYQSP
jgi:hypothetical protein